MVKSDNNSKFMFKMIVLVIAVIINIIALIGVFITVGQTIKNLREDIAEGKINRNVSQVQEENSISLQEYSDSDEDEDMGGDLELNIDTSSIIKAVMQDKNAMKSIVLMAIALVLLALAVFVLVKLKL